MRSDWILTRAETMLFIVGISHFSSFNLSRCFNASLRGYDETLGSSGCKSREIPMLCACTPVAC